MSKVIVSVGKKKFFLQEPLEAAYNNPLKETDYKKKVLRLLHCIMTFLLGQRMLVCLFI